MTGFQGQSKISSHHRPSNHNNHNDRSIDQEKSTIANQAKDYDVMIRLDYKKLKDHAEHCGNPVLDSAFGTKRLLCPVATVATLSSAAP